MGNQKSLPLKVSLKGEILADFNECKKALGVSANAEVVRVAIRELKRYLKGNNKVSAN